MSEASEKQRLLGGSAEVPPLMVQLARHSLNKGQWSLTASSSEGGFGLSLPEVGQQAVSKAGAIALGVSVDMSAFKGAYEDLETVKQASIVPVLCDDFVVYGYQVLTACSSGADAIKLHASVLPVTEIEYNIKV